MEDFASEGTLRKRKRSDDEYSEPDATPDPDLLMEYEDLMRSMLELPATANDVEDTGSGPLEEANTGEDENPGQDAGDMTLGGGASGAKRRKMDKKKLKREEQKRQKAEVIESADFRLFAHQPVKSISLLPPEEAQFITLNPRHRLWTEDELGERRIMSQGAAVEREALLVPCLKAGGVKMSRSWTRKITSVFSEPASPTPPSTVLLLSKIHSPLPVSLLPPSSQPAKQSNIFQKHSQKHPALTKAQKREVDNWKKDTDRRMCVKTRVAERGGAAAERGITILPVAEEVWNKVSVKEKTVKHRVARYWAPPVGLGGKARGYGFGFEKSLQGTREKGRNESEGEEGGNT